MFLFLFLIFVSIPILEVFIIIEVTKNFGGWNTVALVILTGFLGAYFAKQQGREVLSSLKNDVSRGLVPADSLFAGILIFMGGILLITPGFVTDIFGLSLILPPTRILIIQFLKSKLQKAIQTGKVQVKTYGTSGGFSSSSYYYDSHNYSKSSQTEREVGEAKVIDIKSRIESKNNS